MLYEGRIHILNSIFLNFLLTIEKEVN